jgi:hypothetical protein
MICADFLAGGNLQEGNPGTLVLAVRRLVEMLPTGQEKRFFRVQAQCPESRASQARPKTPRVQTLQIAAAGDLAV